MYIIAKENPTHFRMIFSDIKWTRKSANEFRKTLPNGKDLVVIEIEDNPYPNGNITEANLAPPIKNFIQPYKFKNNKMNVKIDIISGSSKVRVRRTDGSESTLCIDLQKAVKYCNENELTVVNKDQIAPFFSQQLRR